MARVVAHFEPPGQELWRLIAGYVPSVMPLAEPAAHVEPQELSQRLAVDYAKRVKPPAQLPLPGA